MEFAPSPIGKSGQRFFHNLRHALDAGEFLIQALMEISKLVVVQPHEVQDRGVQIAHVRSVFHRAKAKFIRGADGLATLHSRAGQPHAEAMPVVVTAGFVDAFAGWRAPEFTAPHQQGLLP